nr:TIGR01777 family oxidoreductase [Desulforhopalus singaporensis]
MKEIEYSRTSHYPCSARRLYDWHSRSGALNRLLPPWQKTAIVRTTGNIETGTRVKLKIYNGPVGFTFCAHHVDNIPGVMFRDVQEKGPFSSWSHSHLFADTLSGSTLTDKIAYTLPLQPFWPRFALRQVQQSLDRIFAHREFLLQQDIRLHSRCSTKPLRLLVTGASGVLGRELIPLLTTGGHSVWRLVRRKPDPNCQEIFWDPARGFLDPGQLPEIDGVIHLAGEYIGLSRWSKQKKERVIDSRVQGTRLLCRVISAMKKKPEVLLCASAVGYYGNSTEKEMSEESPPGSDFISEVCRLWEGATQQAVESGIRTVLLRLGVGLTPRGGALQTILRHSPLGFIRRFGPGTQYISWITTDDMISAMLHCLTCPELDGPVNIAAPEPVTNTEFIKLLARLTGRPLLFPVSGKLLELSYGQMASEILLSGCHVSTVKLQQSGYRFRHPTLETALRQLLGKNNLKPC